METMELEVYVEALLDELGVSRRYMGHALAVEAISRAARDAQQLTCIRRGLLSRLAQLHQCSCPQVERNLRTVISHVWTVNRDGLQKLAAYPLTQVPTVTEFVELLTVYVLREHEKALQGLRA